MTTLQALYGREPRSIPCYITGSSPSDLVVKLFLNRDELLVLLKLNLTKSQARMKKLADKHFYDLEFVVGD